MSLQLQDLGTFLARYADDLLGHVARAFPPVVQAPETLPNLLRPPLGRQALAITAARRALEDYKTAIVVGEMGSGKSYIAAATAAATAQRTLILCPPHLVEKWKDEITKTVPGALVVIAETIRDLEHARKHATPSAPLFVVMSRERAKLGAPTINSGIVFRRGLPRCLHCDAIVYDKRGDVPSPAAVRKMQRPVCHNCGSPLYAPDPARTRRRDGSVRYPLAEYIKRRMKHFFDLLVLDEVHEYKAVDSAQGIAAGLLAEAIPRTLILTGTLFGGYARTLFYLLWRFVKPFREHYSYHEIKKFIETYGAVQYVKVFDKDDRGVTSRKGGRGVKSREIPTTSPMLLYFLLPFTVFLKLGDVASGLPPYTEEVREVDPGPSLQAWYDDLIGWFKKQELRKHPELLGAFFHASVFGPDTARFGFQVQDLYEHPAFEDTDMLPKERALLDLVAEERASGRRVIVFVQNTGERNLAAHLEGLLRERGYRAMALYASTTSARDREAWIRKALKKGLDVLILHPRLVQTGLDLIDFPTLVYYQVEPSVYVLRQAARRSWRIGQRHPVRVVYLIYENTLQARALSLLARKAQASLALEGHLLEGGLNNHAGDDASLSLARALAGSQDVEFDPELIKIATLGIDSAPTSPVPKTNASQPTHEPPPPLPTVAELLAKGARLPSRRPPSGEVQVLFPELLMTG